MRKILLLGLMALLSIIPATQGQNMVFPSCSQSQLATAEGYMSEFRTLTDRALDIETLGDLLSYGAAQVEWRDRTWAGLPLCIEMHLLGLQMNQSADDFAALYALEFIGVDRASNPYEDLLISGAEAYGTSRRWIPNAIENAKEAQREDGGLPACSEVERQALNPSILPGLQALLQQAFEVESIPDAIDYAAAQVEWREALWSELPLCAEAFEFGVIMYHLSGDLAKVRILDLADVAPEENPYQQAFLRGLERFAEIVNWLDDAPRPYRNLPPCSEDVLQLPLYRTMQEHVDFAALPTNTADSLLAFSEAHLHWRGALWSELPSLPGCAEAFEIALLTIQITGDAVAVAALAETGIGFFDVASAYQQQVTEAGIRLDNLAAAIKSADNAETAAPEKRLPSCSSEELDGLSESIVGFSELMYLSQLVETDAQLSTQIKALFDWRRQLWNHLPGCAQAFEIGALMIQSFGDAISYLALAFADVPNQSNPYPRQIAASAEEMSRLQVEMSNMPSSDESEAAPAGLTYFVSANPYANIRACASTNCAIVASAQNGEALTVTDDSKDWYEIRLENGETAYIAGFLMTKDAP